MASKVEQLRQSDFELREVQMESEVSRVKGLTVPVKLGNLSERTAELGVRSQLQAVWENFEAEGLFLVNQDYLGAEKEAMASVVPNVNIELPSGMEKSQRESLQKSAKSAVNTMEMMHFWAGVHKNAKDYSKIEQEFGVSNKDQVEEKIKSLNGALTKQAHELSLKLMGKEVESESLPTERKPIVASVAGIRMEQPRSVWEIAGDLKEEYENISAKKKALVGATVMTAGSVVLGGCTSESISTEVVNPTQSGSEVTQPTQSAEPTEQVNEPTFVPEEIVITPTPPDVNSFVPAVNPPEYQASGGEYSQGAEAVAENNFYKAVYGLYVQEEGVETFGSEELFRKAMDEYLAENGLTVMQSESPVEGQILSLITSKDLKSFYAYVTSEGAMRTSRLDIGDNESTLHKFDLPNGVSLGMTWKQEVGVENAYYFAVDEVSGQAIAWINTGESTTDKLDLRLVGDGDYSQVESFVKVGGAWTARNSEGEDVFIFDVETGAWKEVKIDPNYGYIAPAIWGEESLPLVKEWWEGYKEKMPTNEDVKWMTYEDGSKVEMGEIPGLNYSTTRTFGVVIGAVFDFPPNSIENMDPGNSNKVPDDYEHILLTLLPTNQDKVEEAGNILPIRLTNDPEFNHLVVSLGIVGERGAIKEELRWSYVDIVYNITHRDLLNFLRIGLEGDKPLLYGCQLAVSVGSSDQDEFKHISSLYSEEGDGEWEVENEFFNPPLSTQGHGIFAIPESCMTEELWDVFRTLPNNPGG